MISKNPQSSTLKPQRDRDLAAAGRGGEEDRVAGACSREPSSCDGSWLFPELCVLGHGRDNLRRPHSSMSERRRPCISSSSSSIEKISDTHRHRNVNGGNNKADGGQPPTREDQKINFLGNNNGYVVPPPPPPLVGIIVHDGEEEEEEEVGGGGGIKEEGGTVAGRKKRTWTAEEDEKLRRAVEEHGSGNWMIIERCSGLGRTSKSCRLRWTNHLRPNLKKGSFSESEERTVVMLHQKYGNKWSFIASKLPGRTDNEVKNFWHGRLRRCRKQYLDIYPPAPASIQGDENNFPITSNQQNQNGSNVSVSTTDYDYTNHINNISSHFSSTTTTTTNDHHSNQNQLLLPINQLPVTSSSSSSSHHHHHHHHHHHASLPIINTPQSHHHLHSNIILHQKEPQPPPLPFSKFSSSEQGSINSSGPSSSSISSHKLQSSSQLLASSHQVSSQFNSITTGGSPTESAGQLHFLSTRPTNNNSSPLELKVTTPPPPPYHSYLQVNPSSATSSSPVCNSPKLEIPVTSPPIESLTEMWLNSTLELAKPYSPDFELLQSQSSPSYFNRNSSSISNFTPNPPELPSFQTPENASLLQVQEPHAKTDLLYPILSEKDNPDKSLDNKIPSAKISFKNGKTTDNEIIFLNPNKRKERFDCEGWESIKSSGSQVEKKNLQSRNRMVVDKRLKTEILRGKISRREGLLAEISKTGVLLVEKAKKERLISKLLNQSAKQDVVVLSLSPNSNTENLQLGEISKIKDFLSDNLSIEDILTDKCNLTDEKSEEDDIFLAVNSSLLGENHQNLQETLLDKSSSESVLLTSYEQDEMHDLNVLGIGTQTYGTNLLFKPPVGGICNDELNSVQVFHEISGRDALPCLGLQGQEHELEQPSMNQLESGGYVGLYEADCLNKSLRTEISENSKKEYAEQFQWVEQDDQSLILDDSNWGDGRYIFGNMQTPVRPDILVESSGGIPSLSAGLVMEDGQRNEISLSRKGCEESSRKRCLGESSIERVHGFQELTLNDFLPVTTTTHESTTTCDMLGFDAQCFSRGITVEEDDGHRNIQPEELSSLLEFVPTILPEWNNFTSTS